MTRGDRGRVTIVAETVAPRLDRFLAQRLPAAIAPSRTVAARLVREGWVRVNGAPAKSSQPVDPGDVVTVEPGVAREAMGAEPEDLPLQVVYSGSGRLDLDAPIFNTPDLAVIIVTTDPGAGLLRSRGSAARRVAATGR